MMRDRCDNSAGVMDPSDCIDRIVGSVVGPTAGPTMLAMTMMHGNEPAGYRAARRVLDKINQAQIEVRGEFIVVAGNLKAVRAETRFIDDDLNRYWAPAKLAAILEQRHPDEPSEHQERRELHASLIEIVNRARGEIHFIDLHTSSADGAPFVTVGDTLRNRTFAKNLPLPIMLGLEEQVDGSLLEYLNNFGFLTIGAEAGRHDAEESVDRHEAVLWLALAAAGVISDDSDVDLEYHRNVLRQASQGIPQILEVRYRYPITSESQFQMRPGYANFQPITNGEVLARDRTGDVRAPEAGRILLPLYQGKGDDGFFIARPVRAFWLSISRWLRRLRVSALLPYLPGIRRHPDDSEVLVANTRVARWFPLEIFHLLGYRKLRHVGQVMLVARRRYDLEPPRQIQLS